MNQLSLPLVCPVCLQKTERCVCGNSVKMPKVKVPNVKTKKNNFQSEIIEPVQIENHMLV